MGAIFQSMTAVSRLRLGLLRNPWRFLWRLPCTGIENAREQGRVAKGFGDEEH
jgi:hypothetical protein